MAIRKQREPKRVDKKYKIHFRNVFRNILLSKKITITEASNILGVYETTVYSWLYGIHLPAPRNIRKISKIFNVTPYILFIGDEYKCDNLQKIAKSLNMNVGEFKNLDVEEYIKIFC